MNKDKVINDLLSRIAQLEYEVERLNNIINELEKYLNEQIQKSWEIEEQCYENIESKLEQLKNKKIYGSSKYEVVYFGEALGSDKE